MKLRLLHVINNLRCGGAEVLLRDSLPVMRDRGIDASVMLLSDSGAEIREEIVSMGFSVLSSRAGSLMSPGQLPWIRRLLRNAEPDIVHVHLFPSLYWMALARPPKGPPMVCTEHSTTNRRRGHPCLRTLETLVYRRYDRIVCISEGVRGALLSWIPALSSRTVTVHNGVDLRRIGMARPAERERLFPGCGPGNRLLVMAASFSWKKDQATVVRALALLPERFRLLLPGEGPMRSDVERLAGELGLEGRVSFPGNIPDIPGVLKACDIAVQSSISEGFGLAAVESMAAGVPVVASRVSGLSEVVGEAGVLFGQGDHEGLARAVLEIEGQPGRRDDLVKRGLERAGQFSIEKMVDGLISVYKAVLGRS